MDQIKTIRIQLFPDKIAMNQLTRTMCAYRDACNFLSEQVFCSKDLKQASLQKAYYYYMREQFGLPSQVCQSVIRTVITRYKTLCSNKQDWTCIVFKKLTYDLLWNRDYSLNTKLFSVSTLDGRAKIPFTMNGLDEYFDKSIYQFGTAKLEQRRNKWYLLVPVKWETDDVSSTYTNVVGVDLGLNFIATTYDSHGKSLFFSGRKVKDKRAQYQSIRKELQRKQTASARHKIKQMGQRENRYVKDVNHQITKALVNAYPKGTCFVLEDLSGVRRASERVAKRYRYVNVSWSFYQFRQMLEYKAKANGQTVLVVDPRYTSQTCPKCGTVDKKSRNKKTHQFYCTSCHYQSNDDRVGAMNIRNKGFQQIIELQHA